jgi:monovalent cation:H+ antiporter-2, CPA2 family
MDAHVNLTGMAVVGLSALLCGMLMARFKQPALVGYIIAGVLLGPSAFGVVEDREQIGGLAELGVLLLLFLIGTELSVRFFMVTWKMAMGAVALQVLGSLAAIFLCSIFLGFTAAESVLLGFVIALSSTAVAIKILEETGELRTRTGRIAVAILIGQDLAFLPMLIIVENIGGGTLGFWAIVQIAISVLVLVLLVQKLNKRRVDLPFARIVMGNVDLSPLTGLVYCFGFGAVFGLFGLSPAYGAFLAGLIIGRSRQREQIVHAVRPVQSVLVMVFFLSVGLLIDLKFIAENLSTVLVLLLIVTLFKTAMNIGIMRLMGESWQRASLQGLTLSQLGEFSFLLAATGLSAGAIGEEQSRLVIAVTVLSLSISPLWLTSARRVHGLASRQINTLHELVDAAYGDEVQVVRRGWRRFAIITRILLRHGWARAVRRLPVLGRIKKPHRPVEPEPPVDPKLLTETASQDAPAETNATTPDAADGQIEGKPSGTSENKNA